MPVSGTNTVSSFVRAAFAATFSPFEFLTGQATEANPNPFGLTTAYASNDSLPAMSLTEAADRIRLGSRLQDRWQRTKFLARAGLHTHATRTLLQRLTTPFVDPLWTARPRLGSKLQRPYVHARWSVEDRLSALAAHYDYLPSILSPAQAIAVYREGVTLLGLKGAAQNRSFLVRLAYSNQFEKVGEMTVSVVDVETRTSLANLTFTILDQSGVRTLCIGGIQAGTEPWTRALVQTAAKELYGLRPKALALWCVRHLAKLWAIERITAVSDSMQVPRRSNERAGAQIRHDSFWEESGGSEQADGTWELPREVTRRSMDDMSPAQVKAYESRYALLDDLAPHFLTAVLDLNRDAPHETRFVAIAEAKPAVSPLSLSPDHFTKHPF